MESTGLVIAWGSAAKGRPYQSVDDRCLMPRHDCIIVAFDTRQDMVYRLALRKVLP